MRSGTARRGRTATLGKGELPPCDLRVAPAEHGLGDGYSTNACGSTTRPRRHRQNRTEQDRQQGRNVKRLLRTDRQACLEPEYRQLWPSDITSGLAVVCASTARAVKKARGPGAGYFAGRGVAVERRGCRHEWCLQLTKFVSNMALWWRSTRAVVDDHVMARDTAHRVTRGWTRPCSDAATRIRTCGGRDRFAASRYWKGHPDLEM